MFEIKMRGAPPARFIMDHQCRDCEYRWELMFATAAEHEPYWDEHGEYVGKCCPDCGRFNTHPTDGCTSAPVLVVRGNHDFADRQAKRLYERSNAHYKREGKDEAIENQRSVFKREGLTSDDKVAEVV